MRAALDTDRWMFSDRYNAEARAQRAVEFEDNRHDQSVSSVALKLLGSVVVPGEMEMGPDVRTRYPFWATRLGHREGHRWSREELSRINHTGSVFPKELSIGRVGSS